MHAPSVAQGGSRPNCKLTWTGVPVSRIRLLVRRDRSAVTVLFVSLLDFNLQVADARNSVRERAMSDDDGTRPLQVLASDAQPLLLSLTYAPRRKQADLSAPSRWASCRPP